MENQSRQERKVMRPFEWGMVFICAVLAILAVLHEMGIKMVTRSETSEIVERPKERRQTKAVYYVDKQQEKEVDAVLEDIAKAFSEESKGKNKVSKKDLRAKGLDQQEAAYYDEIKKENQENTSVQDWYNVLKASYKTYDKVKNIFDGVDGEKDNFLDRQAISHIITNPLLSNTLYHQLEEKFNIPVQQSKAFAEKGKKSLDAWAAFVEANKE